MAKKTTNYATKLNKKTQSYSENVDHNIKKEMVSQSKASGIVGAVSLETQVASLWTQKDLKNIFFFVVFASLAIVSIYFINEKSGFLDKISSSIIKFIN